MNNNNLHIANVHANVQNMLVFSDFDGTIIMQDTGHLLFDHYGCGPERRAALEKVLASGECSFREVSKELWGKLRLSLAQGIAWILPSLEIDTGFHDFYSFCIQNDIPFRIISSGLRPLLLAALSKFIGQEMAERIEIISNDVDITPDGVWQPIWKDETPLGHDKAASIRKCMEAGAWMNTSGRSPLIIFIGDGISDFSVVKDVDILFARKGLSLEKHCLEHGIPYVPYETFADIQREMMIFSVYLRHFPTFSSRFFSFFPTFSKTYTTSSTKLRKTPLYDFHIEHGARMVEFSGFNMPLYYKNQSILESHLHVRAKAAIFDVSHMQLQLNISGRLATSFLEFLTPSDVQQIPLNSSVLSVLLNENGGIEDDFMLYRYAEDSFYLITNAITSAKNIAYFQKHLNAWKGANVQIERKTDAALLALQGPLSADILQTHTNHDLTKIRFGGCAFVKVAGLDVHVSRTGYTGEDGFEISVPANKALLLLKTLLSTTEALKLAGLGARDSLRLEAGMCLYGTDINHTITPVEASLSWIIGKRRRMEGGFLGDQQILKQLREGVQQKRVGLIIEETPARHGASIHSIDTSKTIGQITSGCPSPSLKKNIAMGYINTGYHKKNTQVTINVRGKLRKAIIVKMPWIITKYYR
ncbi:hypothetical protein PCANB_000041 [Pneumocystis canis]|nr:hypothetical protein PCANB_000041 [Pneumocystis canis]